jgi:hypothetical protein
VEISWKKCLPFFKHASSSVAPRIAPRISMEKTQCWQLQHFQTFTIILWVQFKLN